MEIIAFGMGAMGLIALVRVEKLIKTLKEKGILENDYKSRVSEVCLLAL